MICPSGLFSSLASSFSDSSIHTLLTSFYTFFLSFLPDPLSFSPYIRLSSKFTSFLPAIPPFLSSYPLFLSPFLPSLICSECDHVAPSCCHCCCYCCRIPNAAIVFAAVAVYARINHNAQKDCGVLAYITAFS